MIQGFVKAILAYGKTLQLIARYRLFKYMLLPGLIGFILGGLVLWGVFQFSDNLELVPMQHVPLEEDKI